MSRTVIVFQEDCILAAGGKEGKYPALSWVEKIPASGQGDGFDRWKQALIDLEPEKKAEPVRLVLPDNLCSSRVLQIPYGKGKQLGRMALAEVRESLHMELVDYSVVCADKNAGMDICGAGVDKQTLERFIEICREADIAISGITIPLEGYLQILRQQESYWNTTSVYLFFEEEGMTSILCQNGRYLYSSRSRIFSERGTLDFGTEIVRNISGILQFYTGRDENPITHVYYAGCLLEDFEVSMEGIEALGLGVIPFRTDERVIMPHKEMSTDWLACLGPMIFNGKKEKLVDLYFSLPKEKGDKKVQQLGNFFLVPALVFGLCMIPAGVLAVMNYLADKENEVRQEWIEDEQVQERYQKALRLEAKLEAIREGMGAIGLSDKNISGYPDFTSHVFQKINEVGTGRIEFLIQSYDTGSGILTFDARSQEVIDIPHYILKLQETGIFHSVDYKGYAFEDEWYVLSLSCTLEGGVS